MTLMSERRESSTEPGTDGAHQKRRRPGNTRRWRASVGVIFLLLLWEAASQAEVVDPFLVPPPSALFVTLLGLTGPDASPPYALWQHIGWSVVRLLAGVGIGCAIGVPLGFAMGTNRFVSIGFRPVLTFLLAVPSLALAPILILFLGLGDSVAITVIAVEATVLMTYNAELGASSVPSSMKWALASMGAGRLTVFCRVVFPASMPSLVTALKLSIGYGWRALIAVESVAATSFGLGYMIFQAQSYMDTETVFAGILSIAVVGYALERLVFGRLEIRINSWYAVNTK